MRRGELLVLRCGLDCADHLSITRSLEERFKAPKSRHLAAIVHPKKLKKTRWFGTADKPFGTTFTQLSYN